MIRLAIIFLLVCVIAWQQGRIDALRLEIDAAGAVPKVNVHEMLRRDGQLLAIMCAK